MPAELFRYHTFKMIYDSLPFAVIPASEANASRPGKPKNIDDAVSLVVRVSTRMRTSERFMNARFQRLAIWYSRYAPGSSRSKNKLARFLHCPNLESILDARKPIRDRRS